MNKATIYFISIFALFIISNHILLAAGKQSTKLTISEAKWLTPDLNKDYKEILSKGEGGRLLLVKFVLENKSKDTFTFKYNTEIYCKVTTSQWAEYISFLWDLTDKAEASGLYFYPYDIPNGVTLQTKKQGYSWVNLGGVPSYLGSHLFVPKGEYQVLIAGGSKFEFVTLFGIYGNYKSLDLVVNGFEATKIRLSQK